MRHIVGLILAIAFLACGHEVKSDLNNLENVVDSTSIVEYEMDEERLSGVEYNNRLSLMQQRVLEQIDILFMSDTNKVDINHENARFEIQMNLTDLDNIVAPEGGDGFKLALQNLLLFYQTELDNGFNEVMPILKKTNLSNDEENILDAYSASFAEKEESLFIQIVTEQEEFATDNNFAIQ